MDDAVRKYEGFGSLELNIMLASIEQTIVQYTQLMMSPQLPAVARQLWEQRDTARNIATEIRAEVQYRRDEEKDLE